MGLLLRDVAVSSSQLLAACFTALVCLMPVTFYLCWLASVNKKSRPTVVSGRWDFALVLAALSGFLLVGGALLLTLVQSDSRSVLRGNFEQVREGWGQNTGSWLFIVIGYFLLVIGAAALTLTNRTRWLSIYNVDLVAAERSIAAALERSHILNATRYGNRWAHGPGILDLVPFRGLSHITVRLLSESAETRAEIERHLRDELLAVGPADNAAGPCLGTLAGAGVLLNFCLVGMSVYVLFFFR